MQIVWSDYSKNRGLRMGIINTDSLKSCLSDAKMKFDGTENDRKDRAGKKKADKNNDIDSLFRDSEKLLENIPTFSKSDS